MTRKRFSEEAALDVLRQIDLDLASIVSVETSLVQSFF
jgi:hypothetical protein